MAIKVQVSTDDAQIIYCFVSLGKTTMQIRYALLYLLHTKKMIIAKIFLILFVISDFLKFSLSSYFESN